MTQQISQTFEARVSLNKYVHGISDTQYSLTHVNALPSSYEHLASAILAAGPSTSLNYSAIISTHY
jgi:hypothetical protein